MLSRVRGVLASAFLYIHSTIVKLREHVRAVLALAFLIAGFIMPQFASHARSVAITINTDVLFGSVNTWITTFLPIFAIGLGIAIALAIIAIVGDSILDGLRRGVH